MAFAARPVAEVMIPRGEMVAVRLGAPVAEVERVLVDTGHSRLPITGRDLDEVLGFVHAKDLLALPEEARDRPLPRPMLRRLLRVAVDRPLDQVLVTMRRSRLHLALVLATDGSTAGLVTLEDLLEAVVGEIRDETDRPG
jgi:CBS domain containing-hemolysin-like protein